MFGSAPVLYVLTATSAAEAAARMSFLNEMNRRDGALVYKVRDTEDRLKRVEAEVVRARQILELTKQSLERDRRTLGRKMAASRRLLAELHERVEQIQYEIARIRPLAVCPVAGPHAIADGFGIRGSGALSVIGAVPLRLTHWPGRALALTVSTTTVWWVTVMS